MPEANQIPEVCRIDPQGLLQSQQRPVEEEKLQKVDIPKDEVYMIDGSGPGILALIYQWIRAALSNDILNFLEGRQMNNDTKATVTGVVTAVVSLVAVFGFTVPADIVTIIVAVGVAVLGYFTNKKGA